MIDFHCYHLVDVHRESKLCSHLLRECAPRLEVLNDTLHFLLCPHNFLALRHVQELWHAASRILTYFLIIIHLLWIEATAWNKYNHFWVFERITDEEFHPLHHWEWYHHKEFIIRIDLFKKLISFKDYFENAQLMVSVHMRYEYEVGLSDDFVKKYFRFEMVPKLGIRALSTIH